MVVLKKQSSQSTGLNKKATKVALIIAGLIHFEGISADLATAQNLVAHSSTWQTNVVNAYDGNNNSEARANARGTDSDVWLEFDFGQTHNNLDITFLEDNVYPYAVSRWKVQGWQNGEWQDLPAGWEAHNSENWDPAYPIDSSYSTDKMRVLFQAGSDNQVGLNELRITGDINDSGNGAQQLATAENFSGQSSTWQSNYDNAYDGNNNSEARANARGTASDVWLEFDFGSEYTNFEVAFLEDNSYPYAVSRWKVQGWVNNAWEDVSSWQAHNSEDFDPAYVISANYTTSKMRVLFQASVDNQVGLKELSIIGTNAETSGNGPTPIVDSDFYTEPTQYSVSYNLKTDYGVNNNDTLDDTAVLQQAIDDISSQPHGGKLYIPAGDYYLLSVQIRSNVHIELAQGATIYPTWNGDGRNHRIFEVGTQGQPKVENFSLVGRGNGFTVDFRASEDPNLAVFNLGHLQNFEISNFTIEDNKTIFASFLVGVTQQGNQLYWPQDGIIEKVTQRNALFGYGVVQTYGADNILFRDLDGEGGITLRMETDNLVMKELKQGGIRNIFAQNIKCSDGLAAVMFGPHFMENGAVEVNGVESDGCGFAVRVDNGFVELFSPANEVHTRESWKAAVEAEIGAGCAATPYARGNGGTRWASRINDVGNCLDEAYRIHGLKPGSFEQSNVYNVVANYGTNAHLKQDQLDYFVLSNPSCANVCLPTTSQWSKQGQIYLGPSIAGVIDPNESGREYNFDINVINLQLIGFPNPHHQIIDGDTDKDRVCSYYGMNACPSNRWD